MHGCANFDLNSVKKLLKATSVGSCFFYSRQEYMLSEGKCCDKLYQFVGMLTGSVLFCFHAVKTRGRGFTTGVKMYLLLKRE